MTTAFWQVQPKHLNALDADDAVNVLRDLLCAEASRLAMPLTSIDVPSALTTKDGGVDGEVRDVPGGASDLLFAGITRYQVKTGSFSLSETGRGLKDVLLKPKARKNKGTYALDDVQPRVRDCLDQNGTLVVASFGDDLVQNDATAVETKIRQFLADIDPRYASAKLRVWKRNQLCLLINKVIGLALRVSGNADMPVRYFDQWQNQRSMRPTLQLGSPQQALIETIRAELQTGVYRRPIRVLGEAGIGKTRLVLEALRDDALAPFVLYSDQPRSFISEIDRFTSQARDSDAIIVVDECSAEERYIIRDRLEFLAPRIRIITIYQEQMESDADAVLAISPLPEDRISEILRGYDTPEADLSLWTSLCEGSPRFAHLIGENLRFDPTNPIQNRDQLLDRTIAGTTAVGSPEFEQVKLVLSSLALFTRFGFEQPFDTEIADIYRCIVHRLDPNISNNNCKKIIRGAKKRRILQGETTLYITPRLLHVWLWTEWWENHGSPEVLSAMLECLPPRLQEWLGDMMQYARESERFGVAARSLFQPGGPLYDLSSIEIGANNRFFLNVSLAIPDHSIHWLEASIDRLSSSELAEIDAPRRAIVPTLRRIAMDADYFERAARLLVRLATTENEKWSNNATGVFAELFSLGWGPNAASATAPEDRLPILLDLLKSERPEERKLALTAFNHTLSTHFIRIGVPDDRHGLRRKDDLWSPSTYGEIHAAYRVYWRALQGNLGGLEEDDRVDAARILLSHARGLSRIRLLADEIISTLKQLSTQQIVDDREIIRVIVDILHYEADTLPAHMLNKFDEVLRSLIPNDFSSLMRRYVGMKVLEDQFDREGRHIEGPNAQVVRLAKQAIENRIALRQELQWLVTAEAENGYEFGITLADHDEAPSASWVFIREAWIAAGDDANDYFIGGYLSGVYQRNPKQWERAVFELIESAGSKTVVTLIIWRSGMTERVGQAVLDMARSEVIPPEALENFSFGKACDLLPANVFLDWIQFLLRHGSRAAVKAALTLSSYRAHHQAIELPDRLVRELLFHEIFFQRAKGSRWDTMDDFNWVEFAERWSGDDKQKLSEAGGAIMRALSISGSIIDHLADRARRLLDEAIAAAPEAMWKELSILITPRRKGVHYGLTEWLRGGDHFGDQTDGGLTKFPRSLILDWIAEDAKTRASQLAYLVPNEITPLTWPGSLWRDLLVRYGDQRSLRVALKSNYFSEGWVGPGSLHHAMKSNELEEILSKEKNTHARRWLKDMLRERQQMSEKETLLEERRE